MRILLGIAAVLALIAASAAFGTSTAPRIWLASPAVVAGSGFPPGKVTLTARLQAGKSVKVVRASTAGRFAAHFDSPIKASGCQSVSVTAVAASGIRATMRVPGNAKDCAPPIDAP